MMAARKREKYIKNLEEMLECCHKAIQQLETDEVDLNDEKSSYIKVSRYKVRFMKIYRKVAKLRREDSSLDRRMDKKIKLGDVSRFPEVNARLQCAANKRWRQNFPDFAEVFEIFVAVNREQNLGYDETYLRHEAAPAFVTVVEILKGRRHRDDSDVLASYLPETNNEDPADKDAEMAAKLDRNYQESERKIVELLEDFSNRNESTIENEGEEEEN